jgi:hypothetical protein
VAKFHVKMKLPVEQNLVYIANGIKYLLLLGMAKNKLFEIIETVGMGYLLAQYHKRRSPEHLYFHNLFSKSRT